MSHRSFAALVSFGVVCAGARAAEVGYLMQPALYGDRLIFVSEGDLWSAQLAPVNADGSEPVIVAHRLTSSDGDESWPVISADGARIAFAAQYDGNTDVYAMPIDGGPPTRLTAHPSPDIPLAWTPDGMSVLFRSPRTNHFNRQELWAVNPTGGPARRFDFGECSMIALSSTGKRFAFTRWSNESWTWKRYRGGTAPEIWIGDFSAGNFTQLTKDSANDLHPMWLMDRVFFASDRTGTVNIFSDKPEGGDIKHHTSFAPVASDPTSVGGYDVRWPSAEAGRRGTRIVFGQAGGLALLDIQSGAVRRLDVRLSSDRADARRRFAPLAGTMTEFALSPDGKSLFIGTRGEIVRIGVDDDVLRQYTRSSGARDWGLGFLGTDRLVLISDATGEQQVAGAPLDGSDQPSLLTQDREAWLFPPVGSDDGRWVAFADKTMRLHVLDMLTLERTQVDAADAGEITDYRFSPDGQWLAYTKPMPNGFSTVCIHSLRTRRSFTISTGLQNDHHARWDPKGLYLYFLSDRAINPVLGNLDMEHITMDTAQLIAVPLAASTPPPLKSIARAAGFDLKKWAGDEEDNTAADKSETTRSQRANPVGEEVEDVDAPHALAIDDAAQPPAPGKSAPAPMRVDTEGLAQRQWILPLEPGNHVQIEAVKGGVIVLTVPTLGVADETWPQPPLGVPIGTLHRLDLVQGETSTLSEKVSVFALSRDGSTIAYPSEDGASFIVRPLAEGGEATTIALAERQIRVDIPGEWRQIYDECWRLQRDFYWAPNMAGVNWPAMKEKYAALLPRIGSRAELSDLIGQLIGELGTSHTYNMGGEPADHAKSVSVGLLGADLAFENGGYRISRIVPSSPWSEELVSPLDQPHLNVKQGDYLLTIDGTRLSSDVDPNELLQDKAGMPVIITVGDDARGANLRTLEVMPVENEQPLRYAAWVEANRCYVEEKSGGRIGYMHMIDMGTDGLINFNRYFYPQIDKPAMIVDVRDNGGGYVSQMLIQRLARRPWAFDQPRHGVTGRIPFRSMQAHMACLIDQKAGSDGDIFPASFRKLGLGPLIGTRTWGGVVGIRMDKPFIDGGVSSQPEFAWWEAEGGWTIENVGVSPDIEIDITPSDRAAGRDPQLDAAIDHLLKKLADDPRDLPKVPEFPKR